MKQGTDTLQQSADEFAIALKFTNTMDWHAAAQPVETLTSYEVVVDWAHSAQILSTDEQASLHHHAAAQPLTAQAVLIQVRQMREAIYRIFVALANGLPPNADELALLNSALKIALAYRQVQPTVDGYTWGWTTLTDQLDGLLRPIVFAAAQLLTSALVDRVKQCEDDRGCGFFFIDTSKNRSRRWCSMDGCGNRAKVQRHRNRTRKGHA